MSFFINPFISEPAAPIIAPTITPPSRTSAKFQEALRRLTSADPGWTAVAMTMVKRTIAVASLKMLSPSINVVSLFGAPISLNNAITATGSVADIRAPKTSAPIKGRVVKRETPTPITPADISSPTTASNRIGTRFLYKT